MVRRERGDGGTKGVEGSDGVGAEMHEVWNRG